jgi:D-xylose transport system permease protein
MDSFHANAAMSIFAHHPPVPSDPPKHWARSTLRRLVADSGALPVVLGLVVLAFIFQSLNQNFLTPGNLVNLMVQGAVYMLLALGMVFVLLIGEVDLSIGIVGGVAGVIVASMVSGSAGYPWWSAVLAGLLAGTSIGLFQGLIITAVRLPSFVVTLAGLLAWNGVMLIILGNGGTVPINDDIIIKLANGILPPVVGWLIAIPLVAIYALDRILLDRRRRLNGNEGASYWSTAGRILGVALIATAIVGLCSVNRGNFAPISGVPLVILIVLFFLVVSSVIQNRTAFGTHIYAIGGNAEAARRAGIPVNRMKVCIFGISGLMGAVAGIIYASRLRSVSTNLDGGTLVLYSIAAAVIGGTSLFGGRGKAVHAILGGLVIAAIDNGMGLLGLSAAARYVVTGIVLLAAVSFDSLARRGRSSPS